MRALLLLAVLYFSALSAQGSLFDALHAESAGIEIRLETDWRKLVRTKKKKTYQPVVVTVTVGGKSHIFNGKLRSRGNVRLEVCQNPSLKLKLKKEELAAAGFNDLNDLKFVLQCSAGAQGLGYLSREQAVYDLHAVYSDYTHRTVPVSLNLNDKETISAFLIEDQEQIAARLNARVLETRKLSTRGLRRTAYVNMCLFNYLILNTDWHVFNLHNLKFVSPDDGGRLIPVPYDFDYSGFVGAHYAIPREELSIGSVHVPKWLGKNVTPAEIKTGAEHYLARRALAEQLIREHPGLAERDRKRIMKRFKAFYRLLEDDKRLLRLIK